MGHKEVSVFTLPYRSKINNNINIQQFELQLTAVDIPHNLHLVIVAKAEVSTGQL